MCGVSGQTLILEIDSTDFSQILEKDGLDPQIQYVYFAIAAKQLVQKLS